MIHVIAVITARPGHAFPTIMASVGHVRSGKLVALGVTTAQRATALPDVPTIQEAGVPGYEVAGW
jgi:tripartite-type tricarboxylate transporter receptor subunit TctC